MYVLGQDCPLKTYQVSILNFQTQNHECDFCITRVMDAGEMLRSRPGRAGPGRPGVRGP